MRRADRLFLLVQALRRRSPVTASDLAEELEVSVRTVYRDVADLVASGVPIEGEADVGYVLEQGFDLPPMTFLDEELEALTLGLRFVESYGDRALADAARLVLGKVRGVLPAGLAARFEGLDLFVPGHQVDERRSRGLEDVRFAMRAQRKLALAYVDEGGTATERVVWPRAWTIHEPCSRSSQAAVLARLRDRSARRRPGQVAEHGEGEKSRQDSG